MITYYPNFRLFLNQRIIDSGDCENLHIYVDVRNGCTPLFYEGYIKSVYENMLTSNKIDISLFSSFINYIIRLRNFFKHKIGFKAVKIFFFMDRGKSSYHKHIVDDYKKNRMLTTMNLNLNIIETVFDCVNKNFDLCEKFINFLPDVFFIKLKDLESDFIPYYLIKKYYNNDNNIKHVIFSTDKDMLQTLLLNDNIYQYIKVSRSNQTFLKSYSIINYLLKDEKTDYSHLKNYINIIMAFVGDIGDHVKGVKGIGYKTSIKHIENFINIGLDDEILKNKILKKEKIDFLTSDKKIKNSINLFNNNLDILNKSYRLISFESLIDFIDIKSGKKEVDYPHNYTLNNEYKKMYIDYIDSIINNENKYNFKLDEFVTSLKNIKGCLLDSCNISLNELKSYFNLNRGSFL